MRLRSLDGLRGFAALAVVLGHALLSSPVFFGALYVPTDIHRFSLDWWLTRPPVNLLWSGSLAVLIFFVLSGLVVLLPFVRPEAVSGAQWAGYYPRRLIRLYVPVWAAVGVAVLLGMAVHRHPIEGLSPWLVIHHDPQQAQVVRDLTLLHGADDSIRPFAEINGPLWTLKWELWFSLLLPIYVALARIGRRGSLIKVAIMLDLIAIGAHTNRPWLLYLPVFGIGAAMAGDLDRITRLADWLRDRRAVALMLFVVALALLDTNALRLLHGPVPVVSAPSQVGASLGAGLVVLLVLVAAPVRKACDSRVAQWLGKVSFSLYLVHEPIVVSVVLLLGKGTSIFVAFAISVPLSLLAGWLFHVVAEGPAHDLSRRVGDAVTRNVSQRRVVTSHLT
ncbi:MAG: acyltransferase [Frankiaceae bacterium]|nr:acyltransferase [Frankiaceae bacterium]